MTATGIIWIVTLLIAARALAELWLNQLNLHHVQVSRVKPSADVLRHVDRATYNRSADYTLARGRLGEWEVLYQSCLLLGVIWSGALPGLYEWMGGAENRSVWWGALFVLVVHSAFGLAALPFDWYAQFHLEERFGFNTTRPSLWIADQIKGHAVGWAIGLPLLALLFKVMGAGGPLWWVWAGLGLIAFQFLMVVVGPLFILPLFNRFTPLPEGAVRDRLWALSRQTGFQARDIQVMDGSRRSRHSNAFFTGLGRFRRIVLYDTLLEQLAEEELAAVLAHEIGHQRCGHVTKLVIGSALFLFTGLGVMAWLLQQAWFAQAFGFAPHATPGLVALILLLVGTFSFWLAPLRNLLSRRFEYQADRYAAEVMGQPTPLINALSRLNERNLSNLSPHPLYSGFHYSHPTLLERERALLTTHP